MQLTSLLLVSREKVPSALKMISSDTRPRQPMLVAPRHVPTRGLLWPPPFPPLPFPSPQAANAIAIKHAAANAGAGRSARALSEATATLCLSPGRRIDPLRGSMDAPGERVKRRLPGDS